MHDMHDSCLSIAFCRFLRFCDGKLPLRVEVRSHHDDRPFIYKAIERAFARKHTQRFQVRVSLSLSFVDKKDAYKTHKKGNTGRK